MEVTLSITAPSSKDLKKKTDHVLNIFLNLLNFDVNDWLISTFFARKEISSELKIVSKLQIVCNVNM